MAAQIPEGVPNIPLDEVKGKVNYAHPDQLAKLDEWVRRGDGIAVYVNVDMGHELLGHTITMSYGSDIAQLAQALPPDPMPDIPDLGILGWRYKLEAVCVLPREETSL